MIDKLRATAGYALGLRRVLQETIGSEEARARIVRSLAGREDAFLGILERGVYANPGSPYAKLLKHADIEIGDVRDLVSNLGLEGALGQLYDAGVYLSSAEVKARMPIRRGSLTIDARESDFDNPLADIHFEGRSSGSTGAPTRVFIGFDLMEHEAPYYSILFEAHGLTDHPLAYWHAALQTALKTTFKHAKNDRRAEKWWTHSRFDWSRDAMKREYVVGMTLLLSRLFGKALPRPRYVPRGEVLQVTRWLADKARLGRPAVLETNHSSAVRVCLAAQENGLDIRGTAFHITGEPYTSAKAEVVAASGARALDRYANVEVGVMGLACARPSSFDDLHLASDKLALIQREKLLPAADAPIKGLVLTTLQPSTPKLWLNVENGDYADVAEHDCGCPFGELGFLTHLSGVRAHDKLTSEGVTFLGNELFDLIEKVLPSRFGGGPTDYQFVEEDVGGLARVSLVIRPSVGVVPEAEAMATVYTAMTAARGGAVMAEEWRQGNTLRVERREPFETATAKIPPLHVLPKSGAAKNGVY